MTYTFLFILCFNSFTNAIHCSILIFSYTGAQVYSIYDLIPKKEKIFATEKLKLKPNGPLQKAKKKFEQTLNACLNSKFYALYMKYRYPFIPMGLQLVETVFQLLAFYAYANSTASRCFLSQSRIVWIRCESASILRRNFPDVSCRLYRSFPKQR